MQVVAVMYSDMNLKNTHMLLMSSDYWLHGVRTFDKIL